jgi:cysteine desulfurase
MHTDAVQMVGKLPVDFRRLGVAALSLAAHKFHGPLGIGALILRAGVPIEPMLFGGHQQEGLRPGTESVALAVGMWTALRAWQREQDSLTARLTGLRDHFEVGLKAALPNIVIHGDRVRRVPQTSSVGFPGLDGQVLFTALDVAGVACSTGSSCASGSTEVSPTLLAMGLPQSMASSSLRFSLGTTTTEAQVDEAVGRIAAVCRQLIA